jgi:hypothetical protein
LAANDGATLGIKPERLERERSSGAKIRSITYAKSAAGCLSPDGLVRWAFLSHPGVVFAIYPSQLGYSGDHRSVISRLPPAAMLTIMGFLSTAGQKILMPLYAYHHLESNLFFSHLVFILSAVIIANVTPAARGRRTGRTFQSR